ncbi:hypothetical protein Emag_005912 [Eimeria magna]
MASSKSGRHTSASEACLRDRKPQNIQTSCGCMRLSRRDACRRLAPHPPRRLTALRQPTTGTAAEAAAAAGAAGAAAAGAAAAAAGGKGSNNDRVRGDESLLLQFSTAAVSHAYSSAVSSRSKGGKAPAAPAAAVVERSCLPEGEGPLSFVDWTKGAPCAPPDGLRYVDGCVFRLEAYSLILHAAAAACGWARLEPIPALTLRFFRDYWGPGRFLVTSKEASNVSFSSRLRPVDVVAATVAAAAVAPAAAAVVVATLAAASAASGAALAA